MLGLLKEFEVNAQYTVRYPPCCHALAPCVIAFWCMVVCKDPPPVRTHSKVHDCRQWYQVSRGAKNCIWIWIGNSIL